MKVTKTKISGPSKTFKVREADHRIFKQCSANTGLDMYELFRLALDVALKHFPEWLDGNQDSSSVNPPVPKPISPVPSAGKITVENSRDANVTLTALAQQHDAITLETLAKMMEGLVSEVRIVKAAIADAGSTKRAVRRPRKRKAPAKKKLDAAANLLANAKKQLG